MSGKMKTSNRQQTKRKNQSRLDISSPRQLSLRKSMMTGWSKNCNAKYISLLYGKGCSRPTIGQLEAHINELYGSHLQDCRHYIYEWKNIFYILYERTCTCKLSRLDIHWVVEWKMHLISWQGTASKLSSHTSGQFKLSRLDIQSCRVEMHLISLRKRRYDMSHSEERKRLTRCA